MARPPRPQEEVEKIKSNILDAALSLLVSDGFNNLSMAKIGKHIGMTTANLYNYYKNKDELYNVIIIQGYNLLHDVLNSAVEKETTALDKVTALFQAYVTFGISNTHYYHLLFSMNAPKYLDYVGTESEGIALLEKQNSMRVLEFVVSIINEYTGPHPGYKGIDSQLIAMQFWSQLHGLISLVNNGNLREADDNPEQLVQAILHNMKIIIQRGLL